MKHIHVAVGVIWQDQHILLALRGAHLHQGGRWEFPGGKVEAQETVLQALQRELHEELAIEVTEAAPLMQLRYQYPEKLVLLDVWTVSRFAGDPRGVEGQPLRWVPVAQLADYHFPDANQPIVERILQDAGVLSK